MFPGVLIYEMLAGYPPFFDDNPFGIYEKILAGKIEWTRFIDPVAKDLIKKLLVQDRTKRLGNMKVSIFKYAENILRNDYFIIPVKNCTGYLIHYMFIRIPHSAFHSHSSL